MKLIVILKKLDLKLARDEVCALFDSQPIMEKEDVMVIETQRPHLISRLSQARYISEYLLDVPKDTFFHQFSLIPWKDYYRGPFSIRTDGVRDIPEKDFASAVWRSVNNPEVDLKNPKTPIRIIEREGHCFAGLHYWTNIDAGNERRADKRPFHHPCSLDPSLARCMINLTGIESGKITDPFCGTGGILLEAGVMGLEPVGYDIDPRMVEGCRINLETAGIVTPEIKELDALTLDEDLIHVATDLPYGFNTKGSKEEIRIIHERFFQFMNAHLLGTAVIGLASTVDYQSMLGSLEVKGDYIWPLHKSLTKRVLVLRSSR